MIEKIDDQVEKEQVDLSSSKGLTVVLQEEESDEQLEKDFEEEMKELKREIEELGEV